MCPHVLQRHDNDHEVEREVGRDQYHGDADGLLEALEKHRPEKGAQDQRHRDLLTVQPGGHERVFQHVRAGVGGRQRDGDDEVGGRESQ